MGEQQRLPWLEGHWLPVVRCDARGRALADRHYSRQTVGARDFMSNGRPLVMLAERAVWGVLENLDPAGTRRWRCTIFRNEGPVLSSVLIREATQRTYLFWLRRYGALPDVGLTTEVDPTRVRRKRDPGRCFLRAGWQRRPGLTRGLAVFDAPPYDPAAFARE